MSRPVVLLAAACLGTQLAVVVGGRGDGERIGCTAIAVDGGASVDGSAFAGMNADSQVADYRLTYVPAKEFHEGSLRPVYTFNLSYPRFVGYGRGATYHPEHASDPLYVPVGHIPEVRKTHGYYESTEPLMNEHGLGLGESSCAAMLVNKFPDDHADERDVPTGMLDTVTLMQLALERCETARCGVEVMGELAEKHGFVPTPGESVKGLVHGRVSYDDGGEAYTLADRTGEAWVFHVAGGVNGITKSAWAAQRVPPGHLAVVANDFIIGELPLVPDDDFLFNVANRRAAAAAGLWDGGEPFHFSRAFIPDPMTFQSPAGGVPVPLYASLRRWALYDLAAPSLKLPFLINNQGYPFSVKIERNVTHRDVMHYLRYQYEGTEFDLTKGILAGPSGSPFRLEGGSADGQIPRGIAIPRTLYGILTQAGPARQVGWYSIDAPTTSVFVPLLPRVSAVSPLYSEGTQAKFSRSAAWAFNFVSNFMNLNYQEMSRQDVYPAIERWQDTIDAELPLNENGPPDELAAWQLSLQERIIADWWNMSEFLIMKYNDGRINHPTVGFSPGYPAWFTEMIGFGHDVHPIWVQPARAPAEAVVENLVDYVPVSAPLPAGYDFTSESWLWPAARAVAGPAREAPKLVPSAHFAALQAVGTALALCVGAAAGRLWERRAGAAAAREGCGGGYVAIQ